MTRINPALLFLLVGAAFGQPPTPRVVSSGRGWYQGKKLLLRDATVEPNTPLTSANGTGDLILDCGTRGWIVYKCHGKKCNIRPCAEISENDVDVGRATWAHITEMFNPLMRREQAELAVAGVRGSGGPSDAVVIDTPQGVHWASALTRVLEGHYCFRLSHLPAGAGAVRTFTLDWDRTVEKEGISAVPNLLPGLYTLEKGVPSANGGCTVDSEAAWVLVVPQAAFDRVNKQWEEDSAHVDDLDQSGVSTSAVATLRHAILAWLADSVESK